MTKPTLATRRRLLGTDPTSLSIVAACCLVLVSLAAVYQARALPIINPYGAANAAFWPSIVAVVLALLSVMLFVRDLKARRQDRRSDSDGTLDGSIRVREVLPVAIVLLVLPFCLSALGFLVSTLLLFAALSVLFGERRPRVVAATTFVTTAAVYVVFIRLLSIPFPRGTGVLRNLSLLFY